MLALPIAIIIAGIIILILIRNENHIMAPLAGFGACLAILVGIIILICELTT